MTVERFKEHFAAKGEVTDAKLAKTKDGVFRRFGFIGYRTAKEAKNALKYFNGTFIDTSKIEVVEAKAVGDASLPRPWSQHTEGSSARSRRLEQEKALELKRQEAERIRLERHNEAIRKEQERKARFYASEIDDPKLKEFLEVMKPRGGNKGRTWMNDDGELKIEKQGKGMKAEVLAVKNRKPGGEGMLVTRTHVRFGGAEDDDEYQDLDAKDEKDGEGEVVEEKEVDKKVHDTTVSDLDYFRSRMKNLDDGEDKNEDGDGMEEEVEEMDEDAKERDEDIVEPPSNGYSTAENSPSTTPAKPTSDPLLQPKAWDPSKLQQSIPQRALLKGEDEVPPASIIADTGRLFVKNLPFTCTREDLEKLFGRFGPLSEVHLSIDKDSKKPRGFAFILFLLPEHAVKAYGALDNSIFQGRILEVLPGKERPAVKDAEWADGSSSSFKRARELKRKSESNNAVGWNSLFLNSDAVAEAMAMKLGVTKVEILDPSSDNMAVRLAVAETQIIAETKQYLEDEGIDLEAFSRTRLQTRSRTTLLVKNLPAGTTIDEISTLFEKFGMLSRVIVPPTGTIAVVEFLEENEAKVAFRRLAYSKFKHLPLYLEWAPEGSFVPGHVKKVAEKKQQVEEGEGEEEKEKEKEKEVEKPVKRVDKKAAIEKAAGSEKKPTEKVKGVIAPMDEDDDAEPMATLFVKNLNFDTTDEGLKEAFSDVKGLRACKVSTKVDKKGKKLSMGFGFVEFDTKENAKTAMKVKQGFKIDGHEVQLKFSNAHLRMPTSAQNKKREASGKANSKGDMDEAKSTKLIVRNIPFEATKKDIKELFSTFGQVKSVRIPKKFDGSHRGFCFVDFLTKQEALAAFRSLASTHLYGRHLVMEWAEEESSVEAVRKRTAKAFFEDDGVGVGGGKRQKITIESGSLFGKKKGGDDDMDED
ncbi:hypothetical protein HDU97_000679 [Phlyctochytrium planicorne]|nr:hypothetical protein HDU97_000679 [Phlyctochytrium planicorne]